MLCCWWCCHECSSEPLRLPYKYDKLRDRFSMMGQFCSWECMKAWNINGKRYRTADIDQLITLLRKRVHGKIMPIRAAPSRYILKMFGGDVDIEEFRKGLDSKWYQMPGSNYTPIVIHKYEDVKRVAKKEQIRDHHITEESKIDEINETETTNENFVLKRPIPLKRSKNDLATMLGLKTTTIS